MKTLTPDQVSIAEFHSYLLASVAPRPIALASTVDSEGNVNLSPFSFFNVFGSHPPTLVFSPNRRVRDGSGKDTLANVLDVPEVVIHAVDYSMVEQVSLSSCEYPKGTNEFIKAGFTSEESLKVRPPRVREAKAAFECAVKDVITLGEGGGAPNLVICEVLALHVAEDILNAEGKVDTERTDWVARMGGDWYCRASAEARFLVPKPNRDLGVGVDALPASLRSSDLLSGNEKGRLGNVHTLPSPEEVAQFRLESEHLPELSDIKTLLERGEVERAWMAILAREA
jgi:flavin reductase (DIM6/NTAB) family NADH-FMN oxidoreductase RutF